MTRVVDEGAKDIGRAELNDEHGRALCVAREEDLEADAKEARGVEEGGGADEANEAGE